MFTIERIPIQVISCFLFTIEGDEDEMQGSWNLTRHFGSILMLLWYKQTESIILAFRFENIFVLLF